jgi:hypothetical protein
LPARPIPTETAARPAPTAVSRTDFGVKAMRP